MDALAEVCKWAEGEGMLVFGSFRVLVPLLVRVMGGVGIENFGR